MQRTNKVISLILAVIAAAAWAHILYRSRTSWNVPPPLLIFAIVVTVCTLFGWLLLWLSYARGDGETRCRKCRYILRGLSEPRCPECGEPI